MNNLNTLGQLGEGTEQHALQYLRKR